MQTFQRPVPILLYHSISDDATPEFEHLATRPDRFERHMTAIFEEGYTPISVSAFRQAQLQAGAELPERPIVITFDDGFQDNATVALPILKRFGFAATIFISTGFVDGCDHFLGDSGEGHRPMLTRGQILQLEAAGVEIGAHGHSHCALDELAPSQAEAEVRGSKRLLESWLGHPIESFAYPFGVYTRETRGIVKRAGFTSACGVKNGLSALHDDPLALTRITMGADSPLDAESLRHWAVGERLRVAPRERVRWQLRQGARRLRARTWRLWGREDRSGSVQLTGDHSSATGGFGS